MLGRTIAHFRIVEKLGEGGMGEVYKAEDAKLGRTVALKFLSSGLSQDPTASERFLREARAIAALNHPHICTIHETGEFEGRPFFAMEYLRGQTLRDVIAGGPQDPDALLSVSLQLADALWEAHSEGILHRDLKSGNVFLDEKGRVKLLDFGLAKSLVRGDDDASSAKIASPTRTTDEGSGDPTAGTAGTGAGPSLTQTGSTLGTIGYMSPEQVRGEELDPRSDLFSFGIVLYEMATGRRPFQGDYEQAVVYSLLNLSPEPPQQISPALPDTFAAVIERLLEKDPEKRFATAADVRDALVSFPPSE